MTRGVKIIAFLAFSLGVIVGLFSRRPLFWWWEYYWR